jgi:murein DD-endopeptidase
VFYVAKKTNIATHVAGIVDDGVILNSQEPYARLRRISDVSDWFQREGHEVLVRGLDRGALARLAADKKTVYDLDSEFKNFFDMGGVI